MVNQWIYPLWLREKCNRKISSFYKALKSEDVPVEFDSHLHLDLLNEDVGHRSVILNGFYDLPLTTKMLQLSAEGGIMIDVGANYGYFSCLWVSKNKQNKVFAFEASPLNIGPLKNNIAKNNFVDRIVASHIAIGKEKGFLKFDLAKENDQTGWGGFSINDKQGVIEVEVDTLDNIAAINSITNIKVLKIDTEGADTWVLYGAKSLLRQKRISHIFFEENPYRRNLLNIKASEAEDFLKQMNYAVEKVAAHDFYAYPLT